MNDKKISSVKKIKVKTIQSLIFSFNSNKYHKL